MKRMLIIGLMVMAMGSSVYSWNESSAKVVQDIVDPVVKFVESVSCSKGCRTQSKPAPGYNKTDQYWKVADLEEHFKEYRNQYSFDNAMPPSEALAYLPANPDQPLYVVAGGPVSRILSTPVEFPFDAYKHNLKKGDIYFSRSDTTAAAIGQYITSWFHCGVFTDVTEGGTFESQIGQGVLRSRIQRLGKAYSWSVKRVKVSALSESQVALAVDRGIVRYQSKPYIPRMSSKNIRNGFVKAWAQKFDDSSYYCSKLVWRLFYDAGVDLDSNRTTSKVTDLYLMAKTGYGGTNTYAWIGVAADDIYYSPHVGSDIVLVGGENLVRAIPGIAPLLR